MANAPAAITSVLNAPLPEMLERLGNAIANAQFALDQSSIEIARRMGDRSKYGVDIGDDKLSLIELGFTPTFYAFTEATIDIRVAFSMAETQEFGIKAHLGVNYYFVSASVDASYSQKYSFDASGSSSIKAKLVSLPPPPRLAELLREVANKAAEDK